MKEKSEKKFEIIFVCTGNTCRSVMAEGILKNMLKENGVESLKVSSAGICTWENSPASLFAIEVAKHRGLDLSRHRSRQLTQKIIDEADLILAMTAEHLDYVKRIQPDAYHKTYLLKAFTRISSSSNEDQNQGVLFIKDPMGGELADYERSFLEIEDEIRRIFPEILKLSTK